MEGGRWINELNGNEVEVSPAPSVLDNTASKLRVLGGNSLQGTLRISGSKNAALPLMCACLLTDSLVQLDNVPTSLTDVGTLVELLREIGVGVSLERTGTVLLRAHGIKTHAVPRELASRFRASVYVLGPLLARHGQVEVPLPGGCAIGTRPVDFHLRGLEAMGASVEVRGGSVFATAPHGLRGAPIELKRVSVGATGNLMMAACLADGATTISNAAQEPEIVNLGELLIKMGASIQGLGTPRITVHGVPGLLGAFIDVIPDRIETGTWLIACCLTRGSLHLQNTRLDHLAALLELLRPAGLNINTEEETCGVAASCTGGCATIAGANITTEPYPGFPTDLQAPLMTLLTQLEGPSVITETLFENRFLHVPELRKFGASIHVESNRATVTGISPLRGAEVTATDLRAGAALLLGALVAEGETVIDGVAHLDRGYERVVEKLAACGAVIERIK